MTRCVIGHGMSVVLMSVGEGPCPAAETLGLIRRLILPGNVTDNRAIPELFSQCLEGANNSCPGPGRCVPGVLIHQFWRKLHTPSVGASDLATADADVARLATTVGEQARGGKRPGLQVRAGEPAGILCAQARAEDRR